LSFIVLAFELINILMRRKYTEAPQAFRIEYGLCITYILALFEGQTFSSRRCTTATFGKCRLLQLWKMLFCYRFSRQFSIAPMPIWIH